MGVRQAYICIYMYICLYIYIYINITICITIYLSIYLSIYLYMYIYLCVCVCVCVCVYMYIYVYIYIHIHIYMYIFIHIHIMQSGAERYEGAWEYDRPCLPAEWPSGTQFTCFTSTKVQILTQKYKHTPPHSKPLALLVKKYKY